MATHRVTVSGLPDWVPVDRLLHSGDWVSTDEGWNASLPTAAAADLAARLRGVALAGTPVVVRVVPRLGRTATRAGRTAEARRMRQTTPGFTRPGTRVDAEGRMSLTPEVLAMRLGRQATKRSVVDACCGCGGNAIAFARAGCPVTAIEPSRGRLAMARHNAGVYGATVTFLGEPAEAVLGDLEADLLFVDPPWGDYPKTGCTLSDLPVLERLLPFASRFAETWIKVPPAFAPQSIPGARPRAWFGEADGDRHRVKFLLLRLG